MSFFRVEIWFESDKDEAEVAIDFADAIDWKSLGTDAGSYAVFITDGSEYYPDVSRV